MSASGGGGVGFNFLNMQRDVAEEGCKYSFEILFTFPSFGSLVGNPVFWSPKIFNGIILVSVRINKVHVVFILLLSSFKMSKFLPTSSTYQKSKY